MLIVIFLVIAVAPVAAEEAATPSEWRYNAVVYGWLSGLEGTIGVGGQETPVDATFNDLLEFVDFAIAGHFEASNPKMVFLGDVVYTNLGSTRDAQVANQPVTVDLDMTQWIIEAGGGYRVSSEFTLLLAGRYYIIDMGAVSSSNAGGSEGGVSESWGDIYVGARYSNLLREKWIVSVRGDIGAGGSEFAWFGDAALGYRFTDLLSGLISWRILSLDREPDSESSDYFKYDVVQSGLGIALGFSF